VQATVEEVFRAPNLTELYSSGSDAPLIHTDPCTGYRGAPAGSPLALACVNVPTDGTFTNSFVTNALCAPSRATFLTGQYSHNHGVLSNAPPNGGVTALDDTRTLATWMQAAGYRTGMIGKYLNFYGGIDVNRDGTLDIEDAKYVPPGWDDWDVLLDPSTYLMYQYTINRDAGFQQPRPQNFYGPMVVMQNERSASDAEMFPAGFKALGLGKVVGVPTMGAVIGTGSYTLLDGSAIRTPGSGVWTTTSQNMENYGVPPDVHVDNTPADFVKGRDAQIEKAVEVLKAELATKKPSTAQP